MTLALLLSDIHANLPALEAVVADAQTRYRFSEVWVAGDSVGYSAQPNEVVDFLRTLPQLMIVKGNHEVAALGEIPIDTFNPTAGAAAIWTMQNLQPEQAEFLKSLPMVAVRHGVTLCHGTPRDPIWEYLFTSRTAELNLQHFQTDGCVYGHTHIPSLFGLQRNDDWQIRHARDADEFDLTFNRWFINPGSVGQPRDEDPRASYAVIRIQEDRQYPSITYHRVTYDIDRAQDLILQAGLPPALAYRLRRGR